MSGSVSKISISLTSREPRASEGEDDVPADSGVDLPQPTPFRFISEEEVAEGASVVEICFGDVEAIPPGLQAAVDAVVGKDGAGKVSIETINPLEIVL